MGNPVEPGDHASGESTYPVSAGDLMYPLIFSTHRRSVAASGYLRHSALRMLVEFFDSKGLAAIKDEDQRQQWYEDWIAFQASYGLYASLLSPRKYSTVENQFDLLRLTRFLEVFAYFSPAHGYSLQVTFLGLFSILMGTNGALKQEAVAALEQGSLFAFGVSEKDHGSDILAGEFNIAGAAPGRWIASGSKYYIGNANCASIISILAKKANDRSAGRARRTTPILFALRPAQSNGFGNVRKIRTLGIRSAFVGEFQVKEQEIPETDLIAQGRHAWDAVLGTVTLGKFFLGFGSIGICERAFEEAITHLTGRVLYGKPVIDMPHIASTISQAYARLTAMKLYAYRALDYVQAATAADRRYLLFCAVQKARVSTEGVKVISLLSECIGARGFESDTYFEMARRDVELIPSLEGSIHINLGLTVQFMPRYFDHADINLPVPESSAGRHELPENAYLMEARSGQINAISFRPYLEGYQLLKSIANVRIFASQARAFRLFIRSQSPSNRESDIQIAMALGRGMATIAYAQLVAENAARFNMPPEMVSTMFHLLVSDLSASALELASLNHLAKLNRISIRRMVAIPTTPNTDWSLVLQRARMLISEERP
jgi:acyl-CoA dehydrogenase